MVTCYEINRLEELADLRSTWLKLLCRTTNYSFFQTLEWLEASWNHYAHRQRLRVMVVERDSAPIGIVPWCVRHEPRRVGSVRVLTYPLNDWGVFFGPIGPEPQATIRAAFGQLAATPRDWDLIDLRWVDEAADEFQTISEAARESGFPCRARPRAEVRLCRFGQGWDAYLKTRSSNWRRKMRSDMRALGRTGTVRLVRHRPKAGDRGDEPEHLEFFTVCEQIAANSWQADDASQSTFCSPRVHDMLLRTHQAAASLGMLDVNVLYVGDRAAAYNYNYVVEGRTYGLRCGYDQTLELPGCGRILLYLMIEDAFRRSDVEHNFGPGRQEYKDRFATEMRHAYTFRHYARGVRTGLMRLKEEVEARVLPETKFVERGLAP